MSQPRSSRQATGSEAKRGTVGLTMPVPPGMFSESPSSQLPRIVRESAGIHDVTLVSRPCQADCGGNLYISFFVVLSSFFVVVTPLLSFVFKFYGVCLLCFCCFFVRFLFVFCFFWGSGVGRGGGGRICAHFLVFRGL